MQGNLDWATGMFCLIVWSSFWSPFQRSSFGHFCQRSSFWWLFPNLFFFWFPSQAGEVTAVERMASSPYHVSSYIFSHISHIFPLIFSPIFLIYFRRNFPMRFPHPNKNSHTCRSGWQDIAFTQPPKIFAHFRDISFISLQHFEVLLNKQLVFSRIDWTILFWEILISAQVREGLLCWVGLDEEGHSKCQHK